jgi:hypothetical protein
MITYVAPRRATSSRALPLCARLLWFRSSNSDRDLDVRTFESIGNVLIDVNTGAMTTSQWFALATSGFSVSAVSTDCRSFYTSSSFRRLQVTHDENLKGHSERISDHLDTSTLNHLSVLAMLQRH